MKWWYYYLHTNGDIIGKNPTVVDSDPNYFDGDFVRKIWRIDTENRAHAWNLILDAVEMNANPKRVAELIEKWRITKEDAEMFTKMTGQKVVFDSGFPYRLS